MLVASPVFPALVPAFEEHASDVVLGSEVYMPDCIFCSRSMIWANGPYMGSKVHAPPYTHIFLRFDP